VLWGVLSSKWVVFRALLLAVHRADRDLRSFAGTFVDWRSHYGRHSQPAWHCRRTGGNLPGFYPAMEHISGADCRVLYLSNVGVRGDEPRTVRFAGGGN